MRIDPASLDGKERHKLLNGVIVPRPIGWISTVDADGVSNLAPFSWFQVVSSTPPVVMFSSGARNGGLKDTAANALATGNFVVNIVSADLLEAMNATSIEAPAEVDEFAYANLEAAPSERVAAPRVASAPVALECETMHHFEIPSGGNTVIFGQVVLAHVRDDLRDENGYIDMSGLNPVARLAGNDYALLGELVTVARPGD